MFAQARVVHFVPNPLSGARLPVGVIVGLGLRSEFHPALLLPKADSLGDVRLEMLLRTVLDRLSASAVTLDGLPVGAGHHFKLGDLMQLPARSLPDAVRWVQSHILPVPEAISEHPRKPASASARRAVEGLQFFDRLKVGRWLRSRFEPRRALDPWWRERGPLLHPITHWVQGARELVLLEPISFAMTPREVVTEVKLVSTRLAAYTGQIEHHPQPAMIDLAVYLLPGGQPEVRSQTADLLTLGNVRKIYDTQAEADRSRLMKRIQTVGSTAEVA